jgi:hypothetical protein
MNKLCSPIFASIVAGFLGGLLGSLILNPSDSNAVDVGIPPVVTPHFQHVSADGQVLTEILEDYQEGSALTFYGDQGRRIMMLGSADETDTLGAGTNPMMGFYDDEGRLRFQFQLLGPNKSPTLTFYDQMMKKRLELGLHPSVEDEKPFVSYYDIFGVEHDLVAQ